MINTTNTTLRIECDGMLVEERPFATPAETQADLVVENANLRQENTELHELIGVLQRKNRKLRLQLMQAQGAASLLLAVLTIKDEFQVKEQPRWHTDGSPSANLPPVASIGSSPA